MPQSADKKPEKFTKPDGKVGVRMVPVDKNVDEISLDKLKKDIKTAGNYKKVAQAHGADKLKKDLAMLRKGLVKESPEDMEPASPDEKSMAMRQAKFIQYVGEEIMEHLEQDNDFPEWMQNKLSALHQKAKDMHATMAGDYEDDDDMNESKKLDELSPDTLNRYQNKAVDSMGDMKKKAKAHSTLGNDAEAKRLKDKAKKRDAGFSKAFARTQAQAGRKPGETGSPVAKAAKKMPSSYYKKEDVDYILEKLSVSDGMGAWIDDFKKSDAPQFKGKSEKERRDMAIAAYMSAKRGAKNEAMTASQHRMAMLDKIKKSGAVKQGSMSKNESIDEVLDSPEKLDRYKAKAKDSRDRAAKSAVATNLRSKDKPQREHPAKDLKTMAKRTAGLKMADRAAMRKTYKALRKEETVDEAAPKMKGDSFKQERERARQHDAAMGRTATGRKKPVRQMTSTQRSLASLRREEAKPDAAEVMRKKQQMKNISTSDKDKLAKIRTMLNKEK